MNATDAIFYIAVLIMSVVVHEVAHGYVALKKGDKTALYAGRLTLNPVAHLDFFGSILLPLLLYFVQAPFLIGWARPVPYNPYNLIGGKRAEIAVASAGIIANLIIATVFGLFLRFFSATIGSPSLNFALTLIVVVNLVLAIFNMIPIPPLDGSKILLPILPPFLAPLRDFIIKAALPLLIIFLFFFSGLLSPVMSFLFYFITGSPLV